MGDIHFGLAWSATGIMNASVVRWMDCPEEGSVGKRPHLSLFRRIYISATKTQCSKYYSVNSLLYTYGLTSAPEDDLPRLVTVFDFSVPQRVS